MKAALKDFEALFAVIISESVINTSYIYKRKEVLNVPHILLFTGAAKRSFPGGHATD